MANSVPFVAVENEPPRLLPNGKPWLPELWLTVFERLAPMASASYFFGTAKRVQEAVKESGATFTPEQKERSRKVIDAKIIPGLAALGAGVGSVFGPIGTAIGGAVGLAAGLIAWLWD